MATATATKTRRVSAKKIADAIPPLPIPGRPLTIYSVTAFDADGNAIAGTNLPHNWENAEFARDFMRREYRPAMVVITDYLGYSY